MKLSRRKLFGALTVPFISPKALLANPQKNPKLSSLEVLAINSTYGKIAIPQYTFTDTATGFYRPADDRIGIATNGITLGFYGKYPQKH